MLNGEESYLSAEWGDVFGGKGLTGLRKRRRRHVADGGRRAGRRGGGSRGERLERLAVMLVMPHHPHIMIRPASGLRLRSVPADVSPFVPSCCVVLVLREE